MIFKKKKKITIGDFETDDINDFGIAKYYQQRYESLLDDNYKKTTLITDLKNEISHLRDELYKQDEINNELRRKLVELRVNSGQNVITGEWL